MLIVVSVILALVWLSGWLVGRLWARVFVCAALTIGLIVGCDDLFGRVAGPGAGPASGSVYLLTCAVVAWIVASIPSYLILLRKQLVAKDRHRRDRPIDTAWAGKWIRSQHGAD